MRRAIGVVTYLVKVRHFNPQQTGVVASLPFVMMFLGEVLAALLSDGANILRSMAMLPLARKY
ncbi:MAG TPA: hypothetical protein VI251_06875 [Pseudolabrys sp.]|jgi:hypothetical protein